MRFAFRLFLPLLVLCAGLPARAQPAINLDGASLWSAGDQIIIQGVGVAGQGNYDANFRWDAASSSFKLVPDSVAVTGYGGTPYCPTMRFVATADTADGATRTYLGADLSVDAWSRTMQLSLTYQPSGGTAAAEPDFPFRPTRLRLVQNGQVYTLGDISSTANPHFVPDNGWLPNIEPIGALAGAASARIVDFPASFDLTRAFYVFYGDGTPAAPAANGNDTYYYCTH